MSIKKIIKDSFVLIIIILGLALWVVGSNIPEDIKILNIKVKDAMSNLGFMISVLLALQWFYDSYAKKNMINEFLREYNNAKSILESGIYDVTENSKKVDYDPYIKKAKEVIIFCSHYNSRYVEDYYESIKESSAKKIIFMNLKKDAEAINCLKYTRNEDTTHIIPQLKKIERYVNKLKEECPEKDIRIIEFDNILRYSFVKLDDMIWIKFYKNYSEIKNIPAICIYKGCLYSFFESDINKFIKNWESKT